METLSEFYSENKSLNLLGMIEMIKKCFVVLLSFWALMNMKIEGENFELRSREK